MNTGVALALSFFVTAEAENGARSSTATTAGGRNLQAFDFFDISLDLCDNSQDSPQGSGTPELGQCDLSRFPSCSSDEEICYNRKPSRDHFDPINHQPLYYIQYDRVLCYPNTWGGCSSCTPGRYCASEQRCILEELNYPCAQWF
jgi:hypothetical protein